MIIISDSSCLIAFSKINEHHLLQKLFGTIYVTEIVASEFGKKLRDWTKIHKVYKQQPYQSLLKVLDAGKSSFVALTVENMPCQLIIDEQKGRHAALSHILEIIGSIRILTLLKRNG